MPRCGRPGRRSRRCRAGPGRAARSTARSPTRAPGRSAGRRSPSAGASARTARRRRPRSRPGRTGSGRPARTGRRRPVGTARSRPAGSTTRLQSGFGANENEYRCDGMSHAAPGYVLSRHVPPTRSPRSRTTKSPTPACRSRMAMPMPEKPPPTIATATSSPIAPTLPTRRDAGARRRRARQLQGTPVAEPADGEEPGHGRQPVREEPVRQGGRDHRRAGQAGTGQPRHQDGFGGARGHRGPGRPAGPSWPARRGSAAGRCWCAGGPARAVQ